MRKRILCMILLPALLLAGCASTPPKSKQLFAMDTVMSFTLYDAEDALLAQCEQEINRLEALFSVTDADSDITKINLANGQPVTVNTETAALLTQSKVYFQNTNGAFDVTVYAASQLWGFHGETKQVPTKAQTDALAIDSNQLQIHGNQVTLPAGMGIDLGGIAKGYAGDRLATLCKGNSTGGVLNLGGNVVTFGEKSDGSPFAITVQAPTKEGGTLGTLHLTGDNHIVTSGNYQRGFEQSGVWYHHILDPATGRPAQSDLTSVTVVTQSGTMADAYATALYVMGPEKGLELVNNTPDLEAIFVTNENKVQVTAGLQSAFALENPEYNFF